MSERKRVLVTGASRGLGLEITRTLLAKDYAVVGTARKCTDALQAVLACHEGQASFAPFDMSVLDAVHGFVKDLTAGQQPFYGLVNNAAIGADGVLATMHNSDIEKVMAINATAQMILTKYVSRSMLARREGRIVNVSSIIAETGYSGLSVYAASKAALVGFTKSFAREVGRAGITVNAVLPGYMETSMTEGLSSEKFQQIQRRSALRRLPQTTDVAETIAFLLSSAGGSISGSVWTVDAGSTA